MTTRRQHVRDMTLKQIVEVARDLLVTGGPGAVTINAVARRMGMSGPALYRYHASHEDLVAAVTADCYRELTDRVQARRVQGEICLLPMSRALRGWALENRPAFRMIFASPPLPSQQGANEREDRRTARAFAEVFFAEIEAIWTSRGFPVTSLADIAQPLRVQLEVYARQTGNRLPPEVVEVFLRCWIRLYGLLCMEVLEQIDFAIADAEPLFEDCLQQLCTWLAIPYAAP